VTPETIVPEAQRIYSRFIKEGSEQEINIDDNTRIAIRSAISECSCFVIFSITHFVCFVDTPTPDIFAAAEREVYDLMKQNNYYTFLVSSLYNDIQEEEGNVALCGIIHFLSSNHSFPQCKRQTR
jgi:hypothetical protein